MKIVLHKLHEIGHEVHRSIPNAFSHDVTSVADEKVCWRGAFEISGTIAHHYYFQLIVGLQLTRAEISNLNDSLALAPTATRRLIDVKSTVISVEIKQELIRK